MSDTPHRMRYSWSDIGNGLVTNANWSSLLDSGRPIDPYMVWADMTELAGFGGPEASEPQWPLLIELAKADYELPATKVSVEDCRSPDQVGVAFGMLEIAGAYIEDIEGRRKTLTRFVTARAAPCNIGMLLRSEEIVRMQLGIPRLPRVDPQGLVFGLPTQVVEPLYRTVIGVIDDGCAFAHPSFCSPAGEPRVWFLWDQDERRAPDPEGTGWRKTRGFNYGAELGYKVLAAAVARAAGGDELAPYRCVDYVPVEPDPDRHATSLRADGGRQIPEGTMLRATHGTGVMDLAAGVPAPRSTQAAVADDPMALSPGQDAAADSAAAWPIVFVQLPTRTVLDTSGGSLGVHVLDGLRYIMRRADLVPYDEWPLSDAPPTITPPPGGDLEDKPGSTTKNEDNNLIINVSFGAIAGPHDGTSIIEDAMADIMREEPGARGWRRRTWIVLAAGNSHRNGTHVRMQFGGEQGRHQLVWRIGPDNPAETYLEVWLPGVDVDDHPVHPSVWRSFIINVQPPGSLPLVQLRMGDGKLLCGSADPQAAATPLMGAVFARRVVQGRSGTMVLLAIGPTRRARVGERPPREPAPHGDWLVDVTLANAHDKRPMLVHAWAERNDLLHGLRRRQQASVSAEVPVPEPTEFFPEALWFKKHFRDGRGTWSGAEPPRPMQPDSAMGSLAGGVPSRTDPWKLEQNGPRKWFGSIVVAGAYRLADGEMSPYSSGGPARTSPSDAGMSRITSSPPDGATGGGGPAESAVNYESAEGSGGRKWRVRPDMDAPADVGTAMRGLRVVGMLPGSFTRISGTSAAAPQVARFIANQKYWTLREVTKYEYAGFGCDPSSSTPAHQRTAATPETDDQFRKGCQRVP